MPRDNDTDFVKKRGGWDQNDPYRSPKKMMLRIRDVPSLLMLEGKEMLAIPNGPDQGIVQILQQRNQDVHDQKINGDNVQILERMVGGCKNQMTTLTEEGMM